MSDAHRLQPVGHCHAPLNKRPRDCKFGTDGRYIFDRVFKMEATQEQVFRETAMPLLEGVLEGFNATVFAYGVSWLRPSMEFPCHAEL